MTLASFTAKDLYRFYGAKKEKCVLLNLIYISECYVYSCLSGFGAFASPRLHIRYSLTEETSLKLVAGKGFRTANVFMENFGSWASNRRWILQENLQPEIATNLGINMASKFKLNSRDASLSLDGYYTNFENRVIVDLYAHPGTVQVYNLDQSDPDACSRSITIQAEFDWSVHRRLDVRAAYRWVNTQTDYREDDLGYET